jgi:C4-dicarboxylate transporter, DctM subunit
VGFNLFVLQGLTGRELPYLARAALPFFGLLVLAVLLIYVFPQAVLWLPSLM